jgi:hypothetical protein
MAASRFVEVTDKEISSAPKTPQKTCVKILKQLFVSSSVIMGNTQFKTSLITISNNVMKLIVYVKLEDFPC